MDTYLGNCLREYSTVIVCISLIILLVCTNMASGKDKSDKTDTPQASVTDSKTGAHISFDVSEYGAISGDGKDDTKAVLAALEDYKGRSGNGSGSRTHNALQECNCIPGKVSFPKGTYDFYAGSNLADPGTLFSITGHDRLTIDGNGSTFIIHGLTNVFRFTNCRYVTLKNMTITWDHPAFSQGKVIAVEGDHFDVDIPKEFPVTNGMSVGAFMDYDPDTKLPMRHGLDEYGTVTKTELLREQVLRVYLNHPANIKTGVLVVLRHTVYGPGAISATLCENVNVEDVTIHTVPGMAFVAVVTKNVNLKRLHVVPTPGSGYLMTATADATHMAGCKGTITMDGCIYEGMGDDGVNIKSGLYLSLKQKIDDHTVLAAHNLKMIDMPDPDDIMEVSHVDDLIAYNKLHVRRAESMGTDGLIKLTFVDKLPEELREGDVFGNASRAPKVRIKNTEVRNNRARGMLIQTRDAIIEKCKFTNCTGPGLMVLTEVTYFFESIGTRDVTVRNSVFDHCNYGAAMGPASLCAMAWLKDMKYPPKPGVHRNVTFTGNTIKNTDNSAIFVAGVDGINVSDNKIEGACDNPNTDTGSNAIYMMSSKSIKQKNNLIPADKQGKGYKDPLKYGDNIDLTH